MQLGEETTNLLIIGVSAGAGLITVVIAIVSCIFYQRRCCKSRSSQNKDSEVFLDEEKENDIQDNGVTNDSTELLKEKEHDGNNDETNPETTVIEMNCNVSQKSSETPKENGNLPVDTADDVKGERVVSVIYAIPDKSTKQNQDSITNVDAEGHIKDAVNSEDTELNEESSSCGDNSTKVPSSEDTTHVTSPDLDDLYSKPNKTHKNVSNGEQNCANNRVSFADHYTTIRELMDSKEPTSTFEESPTYEDVNLGDISSPVMPVNATPPKLPTDSLTRPPRPPSDDNNDIEEPLYSEANLENDRVILLESSDDVFLPNEGKSKSLHHHQTPPYAQAQLVPRSQSTRERQTSGEEEPKVILGIPGITKPSLTSPGTSPTELDIPEVDFDNNPDYERVVIPNTMSASSNTKEETTEDSESGWVECSIYSRTNNPSTDSTTADNIVDNSDKDESPQLVTYEQTNIGESLNSKQQPQEEQIVPYDVINIAKLSDDEETPQLVTYEQTKIGESSNTKQQPTEEQIAPYDEINIAKLSDEEKTPQLVTYEQTNVMNRRVSDIVEDDYEEIRRSRWGEFAQVTQNQTIDGKDVPVTEL